MKHNLKYPYSLKSLDRLMTCHEDLIAVFMIAANYRNISIIEGVRSLERQKYLKKKGASKTLKSKHLPNKDGKSMAVDAALVPIKWKKKESFKTFAFFIVGIATALYDQGVISHLVKTGTDWDNDFDTTDHSFFDGPHFELYKPGE